MFEFGISITTPFASAHSKQLNSVNETPKVILGFAHLKSSSFFKQYDIWVILFYSFISPISQYPSLH